MSYNGWTNRNTWLVNLYHGDYFRSMVEAGEGVTADYILNFVNEEINRANTDEVSGFIFDVLCMLDINYEELAEAFGPEQEAGQ